MRKASELDTNTRLAAYTLGKALPSYQHGQKKSFKPKFRPHYRTLSSSKQDQGEPMDIDHVQNSKDDKCFKCGKKGHWAKDCWSKGGNNRPGQKGKSNENKGKPKSFGNKNQGKPQGPKKRTPEEFRTHIRALLDENFDEGSREYDEFIELVEQEGF
jgi:hypothetical protein